MFAQDIVLTLISIIGVTGLFMVSYYLDKLMFHRSTQEAAICALIAGSPTIGFLGFAVLDPIYGTNKKTIKKVSVPDNVPVSDEEAKALSEVGIQREIDLMHAEFADHAGKKDAKPMNPTLKSVINAVKKPVAAAPLLAVIFVLIGIRIPAS